VKYLLLSITNSVKDIEHALNILRPAIREAVYLDRTLILDSFTIEAAGNLGHTLENACYSQFVDLSKTFICRIENGDILAIEEPFRYIEATDFDLKGYPNKEVLMIESDQTISAEQNDRYQVIVRQITFQGYVDNYPDILVRFTPSTEVERLTNIVLKAMNTSVGSIKKKLTMEQHMDYPVHGRRSSCAFSYGCLYVADGKQATTPAQIYASSASQIKNNFKYLRMWMPKKKLALYVILAGRTEIDLDGLQPVGKFRTYYYHDFSELKALISGENGRVVNNAMLYSVEKNILCYADAKMAPYQALSGFPITYTNCSIKIPLKYKFMAWYKSLFKDSLLSS